MFVALFVYPTHRNGWEMVKLAENQEKICFRNAMHRFESYGVFDPIVIVKVTRLAALWRRLKVYRQ